jgi:hypothetical protein
VTDFAHPARRIKRLQLTARGRSSRDAIEAFG